MHVAVFTNPLFTFTRGTPYLTFSQPPSTSSPPSSSSSSMCFLALALSLLFDSFLISPLSDPVLQTFSFVNLALQTVEHFHFSECSGKGPLKFFYVELNVRIRKRTYLRKDSAMDCLLASPSELSLSLSLDSPLQPSSSSSSSSSSPLEEDSSFG